MKERQFFTAITTQAKHQANRCKGWIAQQRHIQGGWQCARNFFSLYPPHYETTPEYTAARAWFRRYQPTADGGYDKALDYAWRAFEQIGKASEALDRKAESIMKADGLFAGAIGIGINALQIKSPAAFVPAVIFFIFSLIAAAIAYKPTGHATTAGVNDLLDDVNTGHGHDAYVAGSIYCAIVGSGTVNGWKATRLKYAIGFQVVALVCLLIPVIAFYVPNWR